MIFNDPTPPLPGRQTSRYDTLVVTQDTSLFNQLSAFLNEFEPDRRLLLANDITALDAVEPDIDNCDVMICDMRSPYVSAELGSYAMDRVSDETLSIGLTSEYEASRELLSRRQNLRFSGIIDSRKGWLTNWNQITAIRKAWNNPLMVSRIEEVPVSDVLQMISSGRWSVVVHITGYGMSPQISLMPEKEFKGCISFYQGEPQTAWSWNSAGVQAMFDLLSVKKGVLQVVKNVCTPTIRNIYLQTDEILLSHAVALDESILPAFGRQTTATPEPAVHPRSLSAEKDMTSPAVPPPSESGHASWWAINGKQLITTIENTPPQSFPLRWMNPVELTGIMRDRQQNGILIILGATDTISRVFSACTRGFSADKMDAGDRFPVMRVGRFLDECLYIAGCSPSTSFDPRNAVPAVVFGYQGLDASKFDELRNGRYSPLFTVAGNVTDQLPKESFADDAGRSPVHSLPACDHSWKQLSLLLRSAITTLMTIE